MAVTTDYHCPECGQIAPKPPWLIAREAGFKPDAHCVMLANRKGRLIECLKWKRNDMSIQCDSTCPIGLSHTRKETDKYGRERTVYFDPEGAAVRPSELPGAAPVCVALRAQA